MRVPSHDGRCIDPGGVAAATTAGRYFLCGWLANGIHIGSRMLRWPLSKNLHRRIRVRRDGSSVSEGHLRQALRHAARTRQAGAVD